MNKMQRNYFEESVLDFGLCSNKECPFHLSPFSTKGTTRCPICDEPSELPSTLTPTIRNIKSENVFEKYFTEDVVELFKDFLNVGQDIGNTPLSRNKNISNFVGVKNLFFKEENKNPSGSFKDRGSFMAAVLISAKLKKENLDFQNFTLGTVSTGNMAISTAFMANQINQLNKNMGVKSFVVVSSKTPHKKIEAIQKAAGETGTTLFVVCGEYSNFHQEIYRITQQLRKNGTEIFAQLTDDVFRIAGYSTLFAEIIDQTKNNLLDFIILPVASGAIFRVANFALESLFIKGIINKIPRLVLVQERGADPIINAIEKNLEKIELIKIAQNTIADGIDVSYSRSGNPVIKLLQNNYHLGVNVLPQEILEAQNILSCNGIFVEEASASSLAAARNLRQKGIISDTSNIVCVLTGSNIKKRNLPESSSKTKIINCKLEDLKNRFSQEFRKSKENNMFLYFS